MNLITPWYFTGFVEGEGAFSYSRNGGHPKPLFSLRQNIGYHDLLWNIREFLGCGRLYVCKARPPTKESAYLVVAKNSDLPRVVEHFKDYPLQSQSKAKAFFVWSQMVSESVKNSGKRTAESTAYMNHLADELSTLNLRSYGKSLRFAPSPIIAEGILA